MPPGQIVEQDGPVYSATYSNVPVYEFLYSPNDQIMRRRHDDWINATHILKAADYDKPARTRILEREVQKGVHEKVQGGYGKYQGTWVPLEQGEKLARKNGVYELLKPIFSFVPGSNTPPPAPKHKTAASNKPKLPRTAPSRKNANPKPVPNSRHMHEEDYEDTSQILEEDTPDNSTIVSESMIDDEECVPRGQYSASRKRKRMPEQPNGVSKEDQDHGAYADALLDYFMLHDAEPQYANLRPPTPPTPFQVDKAIDSQGHTALHWAAAMGEVDIVRDLLNRGASKDARNLRGETPLIRASLFANCYERDCFTKMVHLFSDTIAIADNYNGTVFHHVAYTAHGSSKTQRARHYLNVLLNRLRETQDPLQVASCLDIQDHRGDTALHIAARHSKRCLRAFQGVGCSSDIKNQNGETVDQYLRDRAKQKRSDQLPFSSSPIQPEAETPTGRDTVTKASGIFSLSGDTFQAQAARSFSESFTAINEKALEFVQAGEAEFEEKATALSEAMRLLQKATTERNAVRLKTLELTATMEDEDMALLQEEADILTREAEAIQEQKQHRQLHTLVRTEEDKAASRGHGNGASNEEEMSAKITAAHALSTVQKQRRELTKEVVRCQGDEGMTEAGEGLVRLLATAIGVPVQSIPGLADDVLEELETVRSEGLATAATPVGLVVE